MNIFSSFTLKWWQVSIFKLSIISFGIFIGARWSYFFEKYTNVFLVIFIITALYILLIWCKQQNSADKEDS